MPENRAGGLITRPRSEESWRHRLEEIGFALGGRSLFPTSPLSRQTEGFGLVGFPQSYFPGPESAGAGRAEPGPILLTLLVATERFN